VSIILCDVDGVLTEFVPFLISEIRAILPDIKLPEYEDIKDYNIFDYFEKGKALNAVFSCMSRETFWNKMPIKKGAKEAIQKFRSKGHIVLFVTKPWYKCLGWVPTRLEFLQKHFGATEDHVIFTNCKEYVMGDVFIDDSSIHLERWAKVNSNKKTFVFDAPYNKEYQQVNNQRVFAWKKDVDKILKMCDNGKNNEKNT
jgi:5'(3')-deoxyribonucleotidase